MKEYKTGRIKEVEYNNIKSIVVTPDIEKLKEFVISNNINRRYLERLAGICKHPSSNYLTAIFNGRKPLTLNVLIPICIGLDIDYKDFCKIEEVLLP